MFTKPGHLRGDRRTSGRLTRQYLLHIKPARREGLMTRSSDLNLSPCRDHCVVFLRKTLFSPLSISHNESLPLRLGSIYLSFIEIIPNFLLQLLSVYIRHGYRLFFLNSYNK